MVIKGTSCNLKMLAVFANPKYDRAPYQVEIMDAVNDPEIEDIVAMTCSQVG